MLIYNIRKYKKKLEIMKTIDEKRVELKDHYDIILQIDDNEITQVKYERFIFDIIEWFNDSVEVEMFYNTFFIFARKFCERGFIKIKHIPVF